MLKVVAGSSTAFGIFAPSVERQTLEEAMEWVWKRQ